jgi:hypothetical protein
MEISGATISAERLDMAAESMQFSEESQLSAPEQLTIKADASVELLPKCQLKLSSDHPVLIECKDFYSSGKIEFQQLKIKAQHLISLWRAEMRGKQLTLESDYLIAGWSRFIVEDKFDVTSIFSMLGFCHIAAKYYSNTSLIDLSFSLYTPATFEISIQNGFSLLLASANTAISILHFIIHDPVVHAALIATRSVLNTLPALIQLVRMAHDIYDSGSKPADKITMIKLANQVKTLIFSLAGLGYSIQTIVPQFSHFSADHSMLFTPPKWDDVRTTLNNINDTLTPLMTMAMPGKQVSNIINIDFDLSVGSIAVTKSSLFNVSGGLGASFMESQSSIVSANPNPVSASLNPGFTSETGLFDFSVASGAVLPVGSHSKRFLAIDERAIVPLPQYQVSILADQLRTDKHYRESSVTVRRANISGDFIVEKSHVSIEEFDEAKDSHVEFSQSNVEVHEIKTHEHSSIVAISSKVAADQVDLPETNGMQAIASDVHIGKLNVEGVFAADAHSHISGDEFTFSKTAKIGSRTSDWSVGKLSSRVDFDLELDEKKSYHQHSHSKDPKPVLFEYHSKSPLIPKMDRGAIVYESPGDVKVKDRHIVSVSPIAIEAPNIEIKGNNSSNVAIAFDAAHSIHAKGKKTVTVHEDNHDGFFSSSKKRTEITTFENATVQSDQAVSMKAEKIALKGVDLQAPDIHLVASEIKVDHLSGKNVYEKDDSNWFHDHSTQESNDVESASHLVADSLSVIGKHVNLHDSDIDAKHTEIICDDLKASASILKTIHDESYSGIALSGPMMPNLNHLAMNDVSIPSIASGVNAVAAVVDDVKKGDILDGISHITGIDPKLTLSFGKSESHEMQERIGEGYIHTDDLVIHASGSIQLENNFGIEAKGESDISAKSFSAIAAELHSEITTNSLQLVDQIGLSGNDFGISHSHGSSHEDHWVGNGLHFNHLTLNADQVDLKGEEVHADVLVGKVNHLSSVSPLNHADSSSDQESIFLSGSFSYAREDAHSQTVDLLTSFSSEQGSLDASRFFVDSLSLTGQEVPGIQAAHTEIHPVVLYDVQHQYSISGLWRDLLPSDQNQSVFSLFQFHFSSDHYQALQDDSLHILHDSHHHHDITLPVYHPAAGQKLFKNLHSFFSSSKVGMIEVKENPPKVPSKKMQNSTISSNMNFDFSDLYQARYPIVSRNIFYDEAVKASSDGWELNFDFDVRDLAKEIREKAYLLEKDLINTTFENLNFAIYKINTLKFAAYSLYGLSAGINLYVVLNAENHFEEVCRVSFLMLTGSAGWELGSALVGSMCAAASPACLIGAGIAGFAGSVGVNVAADYDWHHYLAKIKDNIRIDQQNNSVSLLPFSIFNPQRSVSSSPGILPSFRMT